MYPAAADQSDTGTGKTWVAAEVIRRLKKRTLVVAPKISLFHWRRVLDAMGVPVLDVINYEKLKTRNPWVARPQAYAYQWHPAIELIIWDEAHRCKNRKTGNTNLLLRAHRQGKKNLLLSATLWHDPLELRAIGECLGVFPQMKWSHWLQSVGYDVGLWKTYMWVKSRKRYEELLARLSHQIMARSVKVSWTDVPEFKGRHIGRKLISLPAAQTAALWKQLAEIKVWSPNTLSLLVQWRAAIEAAKVPAYVELTEDLLSQGYSVAVWFEFLESIRKFAEAVGGGCSVVTGETKDRDAQIEAFQSNRARVIALQAHTGGVSLNLGDEDGRHPRVGLVTPLWSARAMIQIFGRLHRANARSATVYYVIYAADTVEERVYARMAKKFEHLSIARADEAVDDIEDADLIPDEVQKILGLPQCDCAEPAAVAEPESAAGCQQKDGAKIAMAPQV